MCRFTYIIITSTGRQHGCVAEDLDIKVNITFEYIARTKTDGHPRRQAHTTGKGKVGLAFVEDPRHTIPGFLLDEDQHL